jgi:hypothetical protein
MTNALPLIPIQVVEVVKVVGEVAQALSVLRADSLFDRAKERCLYHGRQFQMQKDISFSGLGLQTVEDEGSVPSL